MANLDKEAKVATLANGHSIQYDALVSTMPLDITLRWLGKPEWADTLSHRHACAEHSYPGQKLLDLVKDQVQQS